MDILIAKAYGLGNLLMATPIMRAIRHQHPGAVFHLWVDQEPGRTLAEKYEWVDTLYFRDRPQRKFDIAYVLDKHFARLFQDIAPSVITPEKHLGDLCREHGGHEIVELCPPGIELGSDHSMEAPEFEYEGTAEYRGHKYVVLCPFTLNSNPDKKWTASGWAAVANHFLSRGINVVILGGARNDMFDQSQHRESIDYLAPGIIDESHSASILRAVDIIKHSMMCITLDCGLMHLASALKKPILALFGPTWVSKNGPVGGHVLRSSYCQPCYPKACHREVKHGCMKLIESEVVIRAANEIMSRECDCG